MPNMVLTPRLHGNVQNLHVDFHMRCICSSVTDHQPRMGVRTEARFPLRIRTRGALSVLQLQEFVVPQIEDSCPRKTFEDKTCSPWRGGRCLPPVPWWCCQSPRLCTRALVWSFGHHQARKGVSVCACCAASLCTTLCAKTRNSVGDLLQVDT